MSVENSIRDFLILKGVPLFWVDSHMGIIRQGLAGNTHFATHLIEQHVSLSQGHVKRWTAYVRVKWPDTARQGVMGLRYTFNPKAKKAHKLWLNVVED
jgi:hypothetical protein